MSWPMLEPRSDNDYGQYDEEPSKSSPNWSEVLLFPVYLVLVPLLFLLIIIAMILAGVWMLLEPARTDVKAWIKEGKARKWLFVGILIVLAAFLTFGTVEFVVVVGADADHAIMTEDLGDALGNCALARRTVADNAQDDRTCDCFERHREVSLKIGHCAHANWSAVDDARRCRVDWNH